MNDDEEKVERALAVTATRRSDALTLASGRRVEVEPTSEGELVRVRAPSGECVVSIELTERGPVLRFTAASLELAAPRVAIACDELAIRATGDATLDAKNIALRAEPGGVTLRANDDITIDGERVRLNSTDPPMPLTVEEYVERKRAQKAER
jgi:hypothetical protein